MSNKSALIFDLDDTLYSESSYFYAVFSRFCSIYGWPISSYLFIVENFSYLRLHEKDIFGFFLDHNSNLWEGNHNDINSKLRVAFHNELFKLYKEIHASLAPNDGADDLIHFALANGFKIGVLTNGVVEAQINKWECLAISNKSEIFFMPARKCKLEKPDSAPFHAISCSLGVDINLSIFVGDRFENDLAYPISLGAIGILVGHEREDLGLYNNLFYASNLIGVRSVIEYIYTMGVQC